MVQLLKLSAVILTLLHFLGPWGSLGLLAALLVVIVVLRAFGDRLLEWFIDRGIHGAGRVMKEATVTIHSITPAPEPDPSVWRTGDDEEDDEFEAQLEASGMPEGDFDWCKIDATIEPKADAEQGTPSWEPSMILVRKDDDTSRHALELDVHCLVTHVEVWQNGQFVPSDHGSLEGPARIRLHVGVTPGTQAVELNYLGERLTQLRLPSPRRPHGGTTRPLSTPVERTLVGRSPSGHA
jgi:hypothetical protein